MEKIKKLKLSEVIKSDRFWSAGSIIGKINELVERVNEQPGERFETETEKLMVAYDMLNNPEFVEKIKEEKTNDQYQFWIENALNGYILKVRHKDSGEEHKEIYSNLDSLQSRINTFLTTGSAVEGSLSGIKKKLKVIEEKEKRIRKQNAIAYGYGINYEDKEDA